MKKLSLLFIFCMVSMLAFAQAQSPNYLGSGFSANDAPPPGGTQELPRDSVGGGTTQQGLSEELSPADDVTLDPASWDYGQVAVDFAYDKVFTLTNNRDNSITITGIFARTTPPFSVVATTCQISLPGHGAHCSITVQVDAESPGHKSGALTVECTGAPDCPFTSTLTATAVPDVTLSTGSCYLISQQIGVPSPFCPITLMNNEPVRLTGVSVGTDSPFSQTNNCVPSVQANSSCTIDAVYTPVEDGIVHGTLSVADGSRDGTPTPSTVNLTGEVICLWPPHCDVQ
jgi:hypothetical protein